MRVMALVGRSAGVATLLVGTSCAAVFPELAHQHQWSSAKELCERDKAACEVKCKAATGNGLTKESHSVCAFAAANYILDHKDTLGTDADVRGGRFPFTAKPVPVGPKGGTQILQMWASDACRIGASQKACEAEVLVASISGDATADQAAHWAHLECGNVSAGYTADADCPLFQDVTHVLAMGNRLFSWESVGGRGIEPKKNFVKQADKACASGFQKACTASRRVGLIIRYEEAASLAGGNVEMKGHLVLAKSAMESAGNFDQADAEITAAMRPVVEARKKAADFETRCDAGSSESCYHIAYILNDGKIVPRNAPKAAELFERACGSTDTWTVDPRDPHPQGHACDVAASLYADGSAVHQDVARAISLYSKGCEASHGEGCFQLGDRHERGADGLPKSLPDALRFYTKGCTLGSASACNAMGVAHGEGSGVPKDWAKAVHYFELACPAGSEPGSPGCNNLQTALQTWQALAQAGDWLVTRQFLLGEAIKAPSANWRGGAAGQRHDISLTSTIIAAYIPSDFCPAKKAFLGQFTSRAASVAEFQRRVADHCSKQPPAGQTWRGEHVVLSSQCPTAFATACP